MNLSELHTVHICAGGVAPGNRADVCQILSIVGEQDTRSFSESNGLPVLGMLSLDPLALVTHFHRR
jgi:hypothetical protein